jgi:hypothetical protein
MVVARPVALWGHMVSREVLMHCSCGYLCRCTFFHRPRVLLAERFVTLDICLFDAATMYSQGCSGGSGFGGVSANFPGGVSEYAAS